MVIDIMKTRKGSLLIILVIMIINACSSGGSKRERLEVDMPDMETEQAAKAGVQTARQIFYSLPSPLETAMILKRAGAKYNEEILNPVENVSKYNTSRSMALNLGIYSTDLSYASLFDQTQASIRYMSASKRMAEGLGILNAIDNTVIQKLEENVNNREVIMDIISETFLNTNSILEENDRVAIGAIILVGGWIEGLYIATSLIDDVHKTDNELVERIIDQKLSLATVINLLEQHKEHPDIKEVLEDIKRIKNIYDSIQISVSKIEAIPNDSGVTTLSSKNVVSVSPKIFNELKVLVAEIRTSYTM